MKRVQFLMQAKNELENNPKLHPLDRKMLLQRVKLASKHPFWDSQPVRKFLQDAPKEDGHITNGCIEKVSKEALQLPEGFEWVTLDLDI